MKITLNTEEYSAATILESDLTFSTRYSKICLQNNNFVNVQSLEREGVNLSPTYHSIFQCSLLNRDRWQVDADTWCLKAEHRNFCSFTRAGEIYNLQSRSSPASIDDADLSSGGFLLLFSLLRYLPGPLSFWISFHTGGCHSPVACRTYPMKSASWLLSPIPHHPRHPYPTFVRKQSMSPIFTSEATGKWAIQTLPLKARLLTFLLARELKINGEMFQNMTCQHWKVARMHEVLM